MYKFLKTIYFADYNTLTSQLASMERPHEETFETFNTRMTVIAD